MKLDFMSAGKDVSDHNDLSGEENLTDAIELSDEDLAGVVGARRRREAHHERRERREQRERRQHREGRERHRI